MAAYVYGDADVQGISLRRRRVLWESLGNRTPKGFNAEIPNQERVATYLALAQWINRLPVIDEREAQKLKRFLEAFLQVCDQDPAFDTLQQSAILLAPFYAAERVPSDLRQGLLFDLVQVCLDWAPLSALMRLRFLLSNNLRLEGLSGWKEAEEYFTSEVTSRAVEAVKSALTDQMQGDLSPRVLVVALEAWPQVPNGFLDSIDEEAQVRLAEAVEGLYKVSGGRDITGLIGPILSSKVLTHLQTRTELWQKLDRDLRHRASLEMKGDHVDEPLDGTMG